MGKNTKEKTKPKYSMRKTTAFMLGTAWRTHKSVIVLAFALAVIRVALSVSEMVISPVILGQIESSAPLWSLLATIGIFIGAQLVLSGLSEYIGTNAGYGRIYVRKQLIRMIARKCSSTSYPNTLRTDFATLCRSAFRACSGNNEPTEGIWSTLKSIVRNILGFAIYLAFLTGLDPWLAVIVTATSAASYFIGNKINEWDHRHREERDELDKTLGYIENTAESRGAAKDIRIFGLGTWLSDVHDKTLKLVYSFMGKREKVHFAADAVDLQATLLRNGVAYAYLIAFTVKNGLPASQFLFYFGTVSGFTAWVTGILSGFSDLHRGSIKLSALMEFLNYPEPFRFEDGEALKVTPGMPCKIELDDVSFRYDGAAKDTLSHINLMVEPGEKIAIVGLNGAGKTTLVKLISGLLDPTEGRVLLNGEDIRKYNRRDYYRLFSSVFQDLSMLEATVSENVAQCVSGIDGERVRRCIDAAGLTGKIESLPEKYETHIGRNVWEDGVELSGGEMQRLMLARALYKDGPVLLLDEPTAALDPIAESDIYNRYNEMTKGRTSFFISHRRASTRFCDRILFLADGRIAEEGTHASLLAAGGEYAKLFEVQSKYYREDVKRDA